MNIAYRRTPHAAHYAQGGGHDLEQWDVSPATWSDPRPAGVPSDAEPLCRYVDADGAHIVFVRRAPLSPGVCADCEDGRRFRALLRRSVL